jgi:hypothetical protein
MKLSEVRPFVDRQCEDLCSQADAGRHANSGTIRRALAEAFMAGVRSQGLRYTSDVNLWAACGCEPTEAPSKEGSK